MLNKTTSNRTKTKYYKEKTKTKTNINPTIREVGLIFNAPQEKMRRDFNFKKFVEQHRKADFAQLNRDEME